MSSSETKVQVSSADPFAEVSLVDAHYRVRASGLGTIEQSLPPGLYVARARSGDVTQQQTLRITAGATEEHVRFGEVGLLRSSAPEEIASQQAAVAQYLPAGRQDDGWVLLGLRGGGRGSGETSLASAPLPPESLQGFALCTLDGEVVHDLGALPATVTPSGHQAVVAVAPPGWYALAIPVDQGRRALFPLRVQPQWSPSVFIEMRPDEAAWRPNLDTMQVSYDPAEWGIYRNPQRLRAIEEARRALARGRGAQTPEVMGILYEQGFEDPMLGLLAIALLLAGGEASSAFTEVLENTGELLGHDHPDLVIARAVARRDRLAPGLQRHRGDRGALVAPPLLRANWDRLLGLKERQGELLDPAGPLFAPARNALRAEVWMLWWQAPPTSMAFATPAAKGPQQQRRVKRAAGSAEALLAELFSKWKGRLSDPRAVRSWYNDHWMSLSAVERSVVRAYMQLTELDEPGRTLPKGYASRLAKVADVPLPVLKETLERLSKRLDNPSS